MFDRLKRLFRRKPKPTVRRRHQLPSDHQTPAQRWLMGEDYRDRREDQPDEEGEK